MSITSNLPKNLASIVKNFDDIIQTHIDTISVATLAGLASLASGTTVSLTNDGKGRPLIIYAAAFMPSGTGKSAAANTVRKYLLLWREHELITQLKQGQKNVQDIFLESASAEGLEVSLSNNSSPFFFLDELGMLIKMSKNDTVKQALIRALMGIFDSGTFVTRRLKEDRRASLIQAKGLGVFASSTLGSSNLSNQDIKDMIQNGALNRFLVTFSGIKSIPLKDELTQKEEAEVANFALRFHQTATNKHYSFDNSALKFYQDFHEKINKEYLDKLYLQDDGAGLTVRQLTFLQRIAAIFQICIDVQNNDQKNNLISFQACELSYQFLDFLDQNHFSQINLYTNSKSGKISPEIRVANKIGKEPGITLRKLVTDLSWCLKSDQVKNALNNLKLTKKILDKDGQLYKA